MEVVGENRAQDLQSEARAYGDAFRWHFIGHLQSNKAKVLNETCELVHSLSSLSAARRLDRAGPRRGQPLGRALEVGDSRRGSSRAFLDARRASPGPHDDAAGDGRSRGLPAVVRAAARARGAARPRGALDGHEPGLPHRRRGGRDARPCGQRALRGLHPCRPWASPTSGTARSSTSGSPRRTTTGTRTATYRGGARGPLPRAPERAPAGTAARRPRLRVRRLDRPVRGRRRADRPRRRRLAERSRGPSGRAAAAPSQRRRRADRGVGEGAPRDPAELQRRAAGRRPVQGRDPGDPQPPELRRRALEAPDRLRQRAHLRARRRHAARRGQGLPADAPQRRGLSRGAREDHRTRRLLQPAQTRCRAKEARRRAEHRRDGRDRRSTWPPSQTRSRASSTCSCSSTCC